MKTTEDARRRSWRRKSTGLRSPKRSFLARAGNVHIDVATSGTRVRAELVGQVR
jgi:hypothetical protein